MLTSELSKLAQLGSGLPKLLPTDLNLPEYRALAGMLNGGPQAENVRRGIRMRLSADRENILMT